MDKHHQNGEIRENGRNGGNGGKALLEMLLDRSGMARRQEQHRQERRPRERRYQELWQWQGTPVTAAWHSSIAASFTFFLLLHTLT